MGNIYECHVCNESFCGSCDSPLQCRKCRREFNESCIAEELGSSLYIICKNCFDSAQDEEKNLWLDRTSRKNYVERIKPRTVLESKRTNISLLKSQLSQLG